MKCLWIISPNAGLHTARQGRKAIQSGYAVESSAYRVQLCSAGSGTYSSRLGPNVRHVVPILACICRALTPTEFFSPDPWTRMTRQSALSCKGAALVSVQSIRLAVHEHQTNCIRTPLAAVLRIPQSGTFLVWAAVSESKYGIVIGDR